VTSNPTTFAKALKSGSYDDAIDLAVAKDATAQDVFERLALEDVEKAADILRPTWEATAGVDGRVSFQLDPSLADDVARSISEGERLFARIDRPNAMIKVPGTDAGVAIARELTERGVPVNVTLLFSVGTYERFAKAYIEALETRLERGEDVAGAASVASLFVSRIDAAIDGQLPAGSPLRSRVAIANAARAYVSSRHLFSGARWDRLRREGARPQRLLWASTATKDPGARDVMYLERLVAPGTVTTVPEATLRAFADHGRVRPKAIEAAAQAADHVLRAVRDSGIDLEAVARRLLVDGLERFHADAGWIRGTIEERARALPSVA
jgi:transaldolase